MDLIYWTERLLKSCISILRTNTHLWYRISASKINSQVYQKRRRSFSAEMCLLGKILLRFTCPIPLSEVSEQWHTKPRNCSNRSRHAVWTTRPGRHKNLPLFAFCLCGLVSCALEPLPACSKGLIVHFPSHLCVQWCRFGGLGHRGSIFTMCVCASPITRSCPTLCNSMDGNLPGSSVHGGSPGKNTRACCHSLLQGIFPTQGQNPGSPTLWEDSLPPEHQGSP